MKKNILSLAVATSVAGAAVTAQAAMYLNLDKLAKCCCSPITMRRTVTRPQCTL